MDQDEIVLRPSAAMLLQSMRDIGYSFQSAVADIVDNSISAGASRIELLNGVRRNDVPYVAIVDNGCGMSNDELIAAMRHGSRDPRDVREDQDLGRFGLGLKTASLSQCRRLTVISRKNGRLAGWCWDLDRVIDANEWILLRVSEVELEAATLEWNIGETGTLVLWESLDRLDVTSHGRDGAMLALNELFAVARTHLGLTFHRFICPDTSDRVTEVALLINGAAIVASDPFARNMTPSSDTHEEATIATSKGRVVAQGYTLPHHSRLSPEQLEGLSLGSTLTESQGLYIYRAKRLIVGGTWLGLATKSEISKLLRVRVDVPTSMDGDWGIDVRKSRIRPPSAVRARLKPLVDRMTDRARRPYTYRGTRQVDQRGLPMWIRIVERGAIRYELNGSHPVLKSAEAVLGTHEIRSLATAIESALPIESMFSDMGAQPQNLAQSSLSDEQLESILSAYVQALSPDTNSLSSDFVKAICDTYPFRGDVRVEPLLRRLRVLD
jgi:hypothetical protein